MQKSRRSGIQYRSKSMKVTWYDLANFIGSYLLLSFKNKYHINMPFQVMHYSLLQETNTFGHLRTNSWCDVILPN